jgi:hypothetical protein
MGRGVSQRRSRIETANTAPQDRKILGALKFINIYKYIQYKKGCPAMQGSPYIKLQVDISS